MEHNFGMYLTGAEAVKAAQAFTAGHCYRSLYANGVKLAQVEIVLEDVVEVAYISSAENVEKAIAALAENGFSGVLYEVYTETVEGCYAQQTSTGRKGIISAQPTSDAQSAQEQPENGEEKEGEKKMLKTNSKQARANIRAYIINHFDGTNYAPKFDYIEQAQQDNAAGRRNVDIFSMVAHAIAATFYAEKCQHDDRYKTGRISRYDLFEDWCAGLPSILDTCYYYNRSAVDDLADILQESDAEKAKYTESQAEKRLTQLIYREIYNVVK